MQSASETTEVSTSEFGAIGQDISSVTDLPDELRTRATQAADAARRAQASSFWSWTTRRKSASCSSACSRDKGHRVIEADRGLLALRLVKDHVPDLIILDAMLPELHGFDIARRIKGSAKYGRIPIIMVSAVYRGWRIAEDLKQNYGIEDYLEKPFRITDMLEAVQRLLDARRPEAGGTEARPGVPVLRGREGPRGRDRRLQGRTDRRRPSST